MIHICFSLPPFYDHFFSIDDLHAHQCESKLNLKTPIWDLYGGGHSRLGYYFWDKGLKDFVALILVFIMILLLFDQ